MPVKVAVTDDKMVAIVGLLAQKDGKKEKIDHAEIFTLLVEKKFEFQNSETLVIKAVEVYNSSRSKMTKFRVYDDRFLKLEKSFKLKIAPDEMTATISAVLSREEVEEIKFQHIARILKKGGVSSCVRAPQLNVLIKELQAKLEVADFLIAEGNYEVMAEDGSLKLSELFTVREKAERAVTQGGARKIAVVDVKRTEKVVPPGRTVLTKYLPVDGQEGLTVTGKHVWSPENKKRVNDPVVVASKNITAKRYNDRIEYLSTVRGFGCFINEQIIEIDEIFDGEFQVIPSDDRMNLFLNLQAAKGGKAIDIEEIYSDIARKKIQVPIDRALVAESVRKINKGLEEKLTRILIATGSQPVNGDNGRIIWSQSLETFYKPSIQDNGSVDYRGGQRFPFVRKGRPAGVWVMATQGQKQGVNILGEVLKAEDGQEIALQIDQSFDLEETEYGNKMARQMIPKISGLLKKKKGIITIDPVFEVAVVDYSTGNIDFEGSLVIKEAIRDGFSVHCTKDVHIHGNVGDCRIECGGDVFMRGGMNGGGSGIIKAGGNIYIKYAENCSLICGGNLFVGTHALLSTLISKNDILVGINRTKGRIIGSKLYAWNRIETDFVGSPSSTVDSLLHLGMDKVVEEELIERKARAEAMKLEITRIQGEMKDPKNFSRAKLESLGLMLNEKIEELNEAIGRSKELEEKLYNQEEDIILVKGEIMAHSVINIKEQSQELYSRDKALRFYLEEGKISREKMALKKR